MEYLTAHYRRQEEGGCSLLLQQYLCRRVPVCFACLCTAEGEKGRRECGKLTESLLSWCRGVSWHRAAGRPGAWIGRLGGELEELTEAFGEDAGPDGVRHSLLLGIGGEILALGGGQDLSLLSTFFGRGKLTALPGRFRGCLEPGAGILLATEGFMQNVGQKGMEEALGLREIGTEEQAARRLKELGEPGKSKVSGMPAAAVLLLAREGAGCARGQEGKV